jgi:hypothetical protein
MRRKVKLLSTLEVMMEVDKLMEKDDWWIPLANSGDKLYKLHKNKMDIIKHSKAYY